MKHLKIVIVGDRFVGKTSLPFTYIQNEFPEPCHLQIYVNSTYWTIKTIDDKEHILSIWDVPCQAGNDQQRPSDYPGTDCFIICYSIANKLSYKNVRSKWFPEIKNYCPNVPIILVGTKLDLREPDLRKYVKTEKGLKLKDKIKAHAFLECSAMNQINLVEVFYEAVRAIELNKSKEKKRFTCYCV